jgi:ArsR family transcriptional regulator
MTNSHDFQRAAGLLKTLAHPVRLKIVCGLLSEPATLSRIARDLGLPISTAAQHLTILRRGGILEERKQGVEVILSIADHRVPALLRTLCAPESSRGRLPHWTWRQLGRSPSAARARS